MLDVSRIRTGGAGNEGIRLTVLVLASLERMGVRHPERNAVVVLGRADGDRGTDHLNKRIPVRRRSMIMPFSLIEPHRSRASAGGQFRSKANPMTRRQGILESTQHPRPYEHVAVSHVFHYSGI